jgi:hypothetical protein
MRAPCATAADAVKSTGRLDVDQDRADHANITSSRFMPHEEFRAKVKSTAGTWIV